MKKSTGQNFIYCTKSNTQLSLTLITHQIKYFACLIFVIEGNRQKFIESENFPPTIEQDRAHWFKYKRGRQTIGNIERLHDRSGGRIELN